MALSMEAEVELASFGGYKECVGAFLGVYFRKI